MAIKHNNVIPNVHFRKWWQRYVKTWFNQAGRKKTRRLARQKKAAAVYPRPAGGLLRPAVHPPTQRYNFKLREGRGFTLDELQKAGIPKKQALSIGVAVDFRRRSQCQESLDLNVARLTEYKEKLMVFPKKSKAKVGDTTKDKLEGLKQNTCKTVLPLPKPSLRVKARAISGAEKDSSACKALRKAFLAKLAVGRMVVKARKDAEKKAAK